MDSGRNDAVYPGVIEWSYQWEEALLVVLVVVLVVGPIMWLMADGLFPLQRRAGRRRNGQRNGRH